MLYLREKGSDGNCRQLHPLLRLPLIYFGLNVPTLLVSYSRSLIIVNWRIEHNRRPMQESTPTIVLFTVSLLFRTLNFKIKLQKLFIHSSLLLILLHLLHLQFLSFFFCPSLSLSSVVDRSGRASGHVSHSLGFRLTGNFPHILQSVMPSLGN